MFSLPYASHFITAIPPQALKTETHVQTEILEQSKYFQRSEQVLAQVANFSKRLECGRLPASPERFTDDRKRAGDAEHCT